MNIIVFQAQGRVPVTVVHLEGKMDGQNYQQLIAKAQELLKGGAHDFLIDLSALTYLSSAGLVALHTVALLARGKNAPDPEHGWAALKSVDRSREIGSQKHVKLLNPTPEVSNVLDMVGFTQLFDIFSEKEKALQSF
jgi:anti-anti-sigma regulatory factor